MNDMDLKCPECGNSWELTTQDMEKCPHCGYHADEHDKDFNKMVKHLSDTELGIVYGLVDAELRKRQWEKL